MQLMNEATNEGEKVYYIPCALRPWDSLTGAVLGLEAKLKSPGMSTAFIEVFKSLEDLRAEYGEDVQYMEFRAR